MEQVLALTCPNCGASTTNKRNCEYCNSLLVRFVEKRIKIDDKDFSDESFIYPGLKMALKRNIELQITSGGRNFVVTDADLDIPNANAQFVASNQLTDGNGSLVFPMAKTPAISVSFYFKDQPNALSKFKQLDIFSLFVDVSLDNMPIYAIDFGDDYVGASQIYTKVMKNVYGATEGNECISNTWENSDEENTEKKSLLNYLEEYWWIIIGIIGGFVLIKGCG